MLLCAWYWIRPPVRVHLCGSRVFDLRSFHLPLIPSLLPYGSIAIFALHCFHCDLLLYICYLVVFTLIFCANATISLTGVRPSSTHGQQNADT